MGHSMMSDTAYSAVPTGGVMTPKVTVVIMIMPNTTSLTPDAAHDGQQEWGQDQGDNGGLHEHTADQQEDDDQQQQDGAVAGDAQQSVCNGDRDVIEHDTVAEHAGERQNDGDDVMSFTLSRRVCSRLSQVSSW